MPSWRRFPRHVPLLLALLPAVLSGQEGRREQGPLTVFPSGHPFAPLFAHLKEPRTYAALVLVSNDTLDIDAAAVAFGQSIGVLRLTGADGSGAVQVGIAGAVFSQFDLRTASLDLLNTDFVIGVPVEWSAGRWSARLWYFHQSSHLGDEFILREQPERVNLSVEQLELLGSVRVGPLRAYGGGGVLLRREPATLDRFVLHGGAEVRPSAVLVDLGQGGAGRIVGGVDLVAAEARDWTPGVNVEIGLEFLTRRSPVARGLQWSIRVQAYRGPTPFGQFFAADIRTVGAGLYLVL